jgi:hypothetical protein
MRALGAQPILQSSTIILGVACSFFLFNLNVLFRNLLFRSSPSSLIERIEV